MSWLNPLTADQRFADALLTYWAKWVKSRPQALGYSRECIESRLMREGVLIPTIGKLEDTNEPAEQIEAIIVRMPHKMKKLVKIEYLTYNTRKIKQKQIHLSEYKYTQLLREAQNRVFDEYDLKNNQVEANLISVR